MKAFGVCGNEQGDIKAMYNISTTEKIYVCGGKDNSCVYVCFHGDSACVI